MLLKNYFDKCRINHCAQCAFIFLQSLLFMSCSGLVPKQSGVYKPIPLRVPGRIPISVRSVRILACAVDEVDGSSQPVSLSEDKIHRVESELRAAMEDDLTSGGPFRTPNPLEPAYILDVEFPEINMPVSSTTYAYQIPGMLLLGIPFLLGLPVGAVEMKAEGVFHLFAPDGQSLVHETIAEIDKSYVVGPYYNKDRPIGYVAGLLIKIFKKDSMARLQPILSRVSVRQKKTFVSTYSSPQEIRPNSMINLRPERPVIIYAPTHQINNIGPGSGTTINGDNAKVEQNFGNKSEENLNKNR